MADFARFLPLSNKAHDDESGVSRDRRSDVAELMDEAARLLDQISPPQRGALAQRFIHDSRLGRAVVLDDQLDAVLTRRAAADAVRVGRPRPVRTLSHTLTSLLRLSTATSARPRVAPLVAGAAALYASGTASLERRAVIAGHTIRATDADWAFGMGPVLEGPALDIAAFLLGESEVPPQPPEATSL